MLVGLLELLVGGVLAAGEVFGEVGELLDHFYVVLWEVCEL